MSKWWSLDNGRWDCTIQLVAHFASLSPIYYAKSSECIQCKRLKNVNGMHRCRSMATFGSQMSCFNLINRISTTDTGLKTRQTLINVQFLLLKSRIPYSALRIALLTRCKYVNTASTGSLLRSIHVINLLFCLGIFCCLSSPKCYFPFTYRAQKLFRVWGISERRREQTETKNRHKFN